MGSIQSCRPGRRPNLGGRTNADPEWLQLSLHRLTIDVDLTISLVRTTNATESDRTNPQWIVLGKQQLYSYR